MLSAARTPCRCAWRACKRQAGASARWRLHALSFEPSQPLGWLGGLQNQRRLLSAGMDAFMEFEREMALKRRREQGGEPRAAPRTAPLTPPVKPRDDECCHLNCPNCVLLVYHEKLMEYELSLEGQHLPPAIPPPKYSVTYLSESGPSKAQQEMLAANDHSEFCVLQNDLISARHKTSDGAWRSVRHIDLRISDDQQLLVSQHASNIGVYAPNDTAVVDRVAMLLGVDQGLVFIAEPLVVEDQAGETTQTEFPDRPFARIGTVRDALTWAFDLNSTPRSSFLRSLAAYATDPDECTRLSTPHVAETIQAQRPMEQVTVADIFGMFPSVRIDFPSFFQIAPVNAPRYYTVSSSHKFSPHTVSITLGLREVKGKPLPRCSSYLAALAPGKDSVRASFLRSSFVFPYHDRRPIMLVSAGTGIAPFRAFIQDLEYEQDLGKGADDGAKDGVVEPSQQQQRRRAFLFYGCRSPGTDFLYSSDIKRALADGILDQVHIEFSESADESSSSVRPKRYVQDAVSDQSELVARHLIEENGYIYVCGGLEMGRAVKRSIAQALVRHPDISNAATEIAAKRLVARLLASHQIVTELW